MQDTETQVATDIVEQLEEMLRDNPIKHLFGEVYTDGKPHKALCGAIAIPQGTPYDPTKQYPYKICENCIAA